MTVFSHALVVGASRGLGRAFCDHLLDRGLAETVFAGCRRPDVLTPREDGRSIPIALDVTEEGSLAEAVTAVEAETDRLDLILNVAGLLHNEDGLFPERKLAEIDIKGLEAWFRVNAFGPVLVARYFHHLLPKRERCVVANLSARVGSISDNRLGGWYTYRASKAAQNMFTKNLSIELPRRARGVIVVALHPGTCDTDLSKPFQRGVPPEKLFPTERAVCRLTEILVGLGEEDNGRFIAWDGQDIPW